MQRIGLALLTVFCAALSASSIEAAVLPGFGPEASFDLSGQQTHTVVVADMNADGLDDLVVTMDGALSGDASVSVMLNDGSGDLNTDENFAAPHPGGIAAGDFDEDGVQDLVIGEFGGASGGRLTLYTKNVLGKFSVATNISVPSSASFISYIAVADFNEDTHLDFAAVNQTVGETLLVYLGAGDGSFTGPLPDPVAHQSTPTRVSAADINQDGHVDLALDTGQILLGAGDGSFFLAPTPLFGPQVLADVNGDGFLDEVSIGGVLAISLGNGDGTFTFLGTQASQADNPAVVVDLNGDGFLDVIAASEAAGAIVVFRGRGDGTFEAEELIATTAPLEVAALDLNSDGLLDLVAPFAAPFNSDNDLISRRLQLAPAAVPTLDEFGLIALGLVVLCAGMLALSSTRSGRRKPRRR